MTRASVQRIVAACFAMLFGVHAHAQLAFQEQYTKIVNGGESIPAYDGGLFGENVALATGATEFSNTDVSLPGNDALPVAFGHRRSIEIAGQHPRYLLGDWDIDVPFLEGIYGAGQGWVVGTQLDPLKRCSGPQAASEIAPPNLNVAGYGVILPRQFWQGVHLHAKAGDRQEILFRAPAFGAPTDGRAYKYVTSGLWQFACTPSLASGHPGEGFVAKAPNGFIYVRLDGRGADHVRPLAACRRKLCRGAGSNPPVSDADRRPPRKLRRLPMDVESSERYRIK